MGNTKDGATNHRDTRRHSNFPPGDSHISVSNSITEIEEKGSFSKHEQEQFGLLMKTVKKHGGIGSLNDSALTELDHIVKVLGGKEDKSTMVKDELNSLISDLKRNTPRQL